MDSLHGRHPADTVTRATGPTLVALLVFTVAPVWAQTPGPTNTITDVPGIAVGHDGRVRDGYRTGTTVVLTESGATTGVSVQGGAPGTKEIGLLEPGGHVTEAHAVVLSGGSAYGLDTATGVMRWLEERGHGFPVEGGVVPIVPAAILYDLGRGGDFSRRPNAEFGYRAAESASSDSMATGRVGAGTGARYGLGSASVRLPGGHTAGAVVGLNPAGSPVDPETCRPYGIFLELDDEFALAPPAPDECPPPEEDDADGSPGDAFNTTIAVVATDAPLDQTQARRMAMVANSGLARSIRPVHGLFDGDVVFGMAATTPPSPELSRPELQEIYEAAADALGRAVVHALIDGGVYCERYPGACRSGARPGDGERRDGGEGGLGGDGQGGGAR